MALKTHNFQKICSLLDREAYDFYRTNRKEVAQGLNDFNLYKKAVSGLFMLMNRMIEESEGGVYIDNLGYFCYVVYPQKSKFFKNYKSVILRNKRYYVYQKSFFPDENVNLLRFITKDMKTIKKYKLHFDICQSKREAYKSARKIAKE